MNIREVERRVWEASDGAVFLEHAQCYDHEVGLMRAKESAETRYYDACVQVNRYKDKKLPDVMRRYLYAKEEAFKAVRRSQGRGKYLGSISDKFERAGELLKLMKRLQDEYRQHRDFVSAMVEKRDAERKARRRRSLAERGKAKRSAVGTRGHGKWRKA